MGPLLPNRVSVQGKSWRESSTDIAIAGLGWIGVGVSGQAALNVWTYQGLPSSPSSAVRQDMHEADLAYVVRMMRLLQ